VNLPESSLERMEKLEQLRAVEHGYRIRVVEVSDDSIGVDTEADYRRLKVLLEGA
jgi:3-deoxy-manno-octulosonate cytidylyltransferase (CMP-KDO synthetase)